MTESSSTIVRCVELLEVLSEESVATPQELADRLHVSRSSVQRLLATLEARGFIERTPRGFTLATYMRVLADITLRGLRSAAYNELRQLADAVHETTLLYVPDGAEMVVLDEAVSTLERPMRVRHPIGSRVPMASSAGGLAFLAFAAPGTRAKHTQKHPRLSEAIARVQRDGCAFTNAMTAPQFAELAVPLRDEQGAAVGSVTLAGPGVRAETLHTRLADLAETATRIIRDRRTDDERRVP